MPSQPAETEQRSLFQECQWWLLLTNAIGIWSEFILFYDFLIYTNFFFRTVSIDEVANYCASQGGAVVYVEVSAKKNLRVEDLFAELFSCANLPLEMAPNHHKKVNTTFGSPCTLPPHLTSNRAKKCTLSIKRRLSDACGVVAPNVRRPSIRTDLRIMQNKTCSTSDGEDGNASSLLKGCVIQ